MDTRPLWNSGIELVRTSARELLPRTSDPGVSQPLSPMRMDPLLTYTEVLQHQILERQKLPPPGTNLNRESQVSWRRLQTHPYPNP
ncbi:hypothetical protein HPB50_006656 [Hyalomma asiaticum]|uniref:Uncharacterized protein n=1 Tax=Hyalomma asiaticum TaxID=266040 RepID=A0ACB7STN3_HYAAI|nr:hypothetical protein HPB50_006656 [Hyalomma asiaticum]